MAAVDGIASQLNSSNGKYTAAVLYRSFNLNVRCLTNKRERRLLPFLNIFCTCTSSFRGGLEICRRFAAVRRFQERQRAKPDPLWKMNNTHRKKIQTPNNLC